MLAMDIGLVQALILDVMSGLPPGPHRVSRVLDAAYSRGASHSFSFSVLQTLGDPRQCPLPLFSHVGNFGLDGSPPADFDHIEIEMTPWGRSIGTLREIPLHLVNGDMPFGGPLPAFDPERVREALRALQRDSDITSESVALILGSVWSSDSVSLSGDLVTLLAGRRAELKIGVPMQIDRSSIAIDRLPTSINAHEVAQTVVELGASGVSQDQEGRMLVTVDTDAEMRAILAFFDRTEPFSRRVISQLRAPWIDLALEWLSHMTGQGHDPISALETPWIVASDT